MNLQHTINAVIRRGDEFGYVAECMELPIVTQGATLDEIAANLSEAVALQLDGEDLALWGLAPDPTLVVTFELKASVA